MAADRGKPIAGQGVREQTPGRLRVNMRCRRLRVGIFVPVARLRGIVVIRWCQNVIDGSLDV